MSAPLMVVIFGSANFFGSPPTPNITSIASGPIPNTISEPPMDLVRRYNYTYMAGVGTHKVHSKLENWNEARRTCLEEGGHLAVVNSPAEAQAIAELLKESNVEWGHIGFHDLFQEGDYVTIHGESLAAAGYEGWHKGEPNNWDNSEDCGVIWTDATLNDGRCEHRHNFICELPHVPTCVTQNQASPKSVYTSIHDVPHPGVGPYSSENFQLS